MAGRLGRFGAVICFLLAFGTEIGSAAPDRYEDAVSVPSGSGLGFRALGAIVDRGGEGAASSSPSSAVPARQFFT